MWRRAVSGPRAIVWGPLVSMLSHMLNRSQLEYKTSQSLKVKGHLSIGPSDGGGEGWACRRPIEAALPLKASADAVVLGALHCPGADPPRHGPDKRGQCRDCFASSGSLGPN